MPELTRRDDEGQHSGASDRGEPRIVGHRQPSRRTESLEVDGRGKADARARDEHAGLRHLRRHRLGRSPRKGGVARGVGHAGAVVGHGQLDGRFFQPQPAGLRERAVRSARKDDLVDLDLDDIAAKLRVSASTG